MRHLIILGILLAAASAAGWFQINRNGDNTTIEIDRAEIRSDARAAIDRGREFLDSREQQIAQERTEQTQRPWGAEQTDLRPNPYYQSTPPGPYRQPTPQYSQQSYPQPQQSYAYPQQGGYQSTTVPPPAYPSQANSYDWPRR